MVIFFHIFSLFFLACSTLFAESELLTMEGYLSPEKIAQLQVQLSSLKSPPKEVFLTIHSQSGDIEKVMDLVKSLFLLRRDSKTKISVFIDEEALGPAAIFCFLADALYISPTATWGAIVSQEQIEIPLNVLRSRVQGLIDPRHPQYLTVKLLAAAMIDPQVQIVSEDGWKETYEAKLGQELVKKKRRNFSY